MNGSDDIYLKVPLHCLMEDKKTEQQNMSYEQSCIFYKKFFAHGAVTFWLSPDTWNVVMYFASTDTEVHIYKLRSTIHQIDEEDGGERKSTLRKK